MIINCISCSKKFNLAETLMPAEGSKVRCGSCFEVWFYHPTRENQSSDETNTIDEVSKDTKNNQQEITTQNEITPEETVFDDEDEMKPSSESTIAPNDEISEETETETGNQENNTPFKIFTDEDSYMPSKQEMDKNLDKFIVDRDSDLGFFGKLFKKDRLTTASEALERKYNGPSEEQQKINQSRRVRLLFYLLFVLCVASTILFVPIKEDISMMFPFSKGYFDFVTPVYDYIKGPLGLR